MDSNAFRAALGRFATGVCVITAKKADGKLIGITINSLASLSLDPALILWSLHKHSDCMDTFNSAEHFQVHILSENQEELSNYYAQKGDHLVRDQDLASSTDSDPQLKDVLATFKCKPWKNYDGGDHVLIVGEVLQLWTSDSDRPLLFFGSAYKQIK